MEGGTTKLLLVTANVGSIFEDVYLSRERLGPPPTTPEHMLKLWLKEFLSAVQDMEPGMVAIHCQEVGGKNYEASMQHVNQFVKAMLGSDELQKYDRARIFLDEDYTAADKFTALGNLYFIHECVEDVSIYDFIEHKFLPVEGREVLSGNIENIQIKEKAKYPQNFFPDFKWSRKGFIRTRWSVNSCVFDLINIHLFHDASNIVAFAKSPSVYCDNRYRALAHTLQRFETDQFEKVPFFLFGDFNFRLDLQSLFKVLTENTEVTEIRGKKNQISKLVYTGADNKVVLTMESKYFDYYEKHNEVFSNHNKMLNKYDIELDAYRDKLYEYTIEFPPSYPFSEDVMDGLSYMKTRCPSWCDRILMSHTARDIICSDEIQKPKYHIIGKDVCMGDHKPVYLLLQVKKGKGKHTPPYDTQSSVDRRKVLAKKISINGETVDFEREKINIHDFAEFENTDELIPEFRISIKAKSVPSLVRQQYWSGVHVENEKLKRTPSFHEIARQVCMMENVLLQWTRRPRSRHHSSSSEDLADNDEDSGGHVKTAENVNEVAKLEKSDSFKTEKIVQIENISIVLSNQDSQEMCIDVTKDGLRKRTGLKQQSYDQEVATDMAYVSNKNSEIVHGVGEKRHRSLHDLVKETNSECLHDKDIMNNKSEALHDKHENVLEKKVDADNKKKEALTDCQRRCPQCVLL